MLYGLVAEEASKDCMRRDDVGDDAGIRRNECGTLASNFKPTPSDSRIPGGGGGGADRGGLRFSGSASHRPFLVYRKGT